MLKFIFTTLIISLLLKINNIDSDLNNLISNLINFFITFILKFDIIKQLFYNNVLNIFKSYYNRVEDLNFLLSFFE